MIVPFSVKTFSLPSFPQIGPHLQTFPAFFLLYISVPQFQSLTKIQTIMFLLLKFIYNWTRFLNIPTSYFWSTIPILYKNFITCTQDSISIVFIAEHSFPYLWPTFKHWLIFRVPVLWRSYRLLHFFNVIHICKLF